MDASRRDLRVPPLLPQQALFLVFCCGIFAFRFPINAGAAALAICLLAAGTRRPAMPGPAYAAAAFGLGLGAAFLAWPAPPGEPPQWITAREKVTVSARVDRVDPRPNGRLRILLDHVTATRKRGEQETVPGKVVWNWDWPVFRPGPGDTVSLQTRIKPVGGFRNPGGFDYAFFWNRQGVYYRIYAKGDGAKAKLLSEKDSFARRFRSSLRRAVIGRAQAPDWRPSPGRGMVLALLTGDRSLLSSNDMALVRRASLSHTLALSGMHVGFTAAMGWLLAWGIGRVRPGVYLRLPLPKLAVCLAAPPVLAYAWLGGCTPSLLRATLMFGCWGALLLMDRNRVLLDGLFLALAAIVLTAPLSVFDIRLQMSAIAVAGIAAFWPLGRRLFNTPPLPKRLRAPVGFFAAILWTSLCAQAALLPILAADFGEISPNIWLNLLWLPVLGWVVMPLAFLGLLARLVPAAHPAAAFLFNLDAVVCDAFFNSLAFLDAKGLLTTWTPGRPGWPEIMGYGLLLYLIAAWRPKQFGRSLAVVLTALVLLAGPGAVRTIAALQRGPTLTMLDVGQGQALVVETPPANRVLVDGGGVFGDFDVGRAVVSPALTQQRAPMLEKIALTHPDFDHYGGLLHPLAHFRVNTFARNETPLDERLAAKFAKALQNTTRTEIWTAGQTIPLTDGLILEVLHPPKGFKGSDNDASLVLRLARDKHGLALLCGDIEKKGIKTLLASKQDLSADVLVVPHHGARGSCSKRFYKAVHPKIALISCGAFNRFRYPSKCVVKSLKSLDCRIYTAAKDGCVRVEWGKGKITVKTWEEQQHPEVVGILSPTGR